MVIYEILVSCIRNGIRISPALFNYGKLMNSRTQVHIGDLSNGFTLCDADAYNVYSAVPEHDSRANCWLCLHIKAAGGRELYKMQQQMEREARDIREQDRGRKQREQKTAELLRNAAGGPQELELYSYQQMHNMMSNPAMCAVLGNMHIEHQIDKAAVRIVPKPTIQEWTEKERQEQLDQIDRNLGYEPTKQLFINKGSGVKVTKDQPHSTITTVLVLGMSGFFGLFVLISLKMIGII